ncbi:hypothetical protein DFH08DRAFT_894937, partial [Mycena albidolilacea]
TAAVVPSSGADIEIRHDHPVKSQETCAGRMTHETRVHRVTFEQFILEPGRLTHLEGLPHGSTCSARGLALPAKSPLVGGHEGVGEIVAIGNNTSHSPVKVGDRVGVKWPADS